MNLSHVHSRLVALLRERVRNGEVTERGFARLVGISQPHIHKVLKGTRTLSLDFFDQVLQRINHSVLDLFSEVELREQLTKVELSPKAEIELLFQQSNIGPGSRWRPGVHRTDHAAIPEWAVASRLWSVVARLKSDDEMKFTRAGFNIAVLDTADHAHKPLLEELYAVDRANDTVLRRVRVGSERIYLVTDRWEGDPLKWEWLPSPRGNPFAAIVGRVACLGREGEREFFKPGYLEEPATSL